MLRTELDALPVEEKTGLPYASKVRTKDDTGRDVGVMHAWATMCIWRPFGEQPQLWPGIKAHGTEHSC